MTNEKKLQVLITIYQEVASHLRATDEKRDRLFNVYVSVVLAVTSGMTLLQINPLQLSSKSIFLALILVLILLVFGEGVIISLIGSRKWHAEYVNCFIILHTMMSKEVYDIQSNQIPQKYRHAYIGGLHTSREFILIEVSITGTYFMAANLLTTQIGDIGYTVAAVLAAITVVFNNIIVNRILHKAESQFWADPKTCWVFSGLTFSNNNKGK